MPPLHSYYTLLYNIWTVVVAFMAQSKQHPFLSKNIRLKEYDYKKWLVLCNQQIRLCKRYI